MTITRETVAHYAKLANLGFSDAEADKMAAQLGQILEYVAKISELDLSQVPATDRILDEEVCFREDRIQPSPGTEAAMVNAPDAESGHFLVPKVINVKS